MRIMVLNDGETYTDVSGCKIVELDESANDRLERGEADVQDLVDDGSAKVERIF